MESYGEKTSDLKLSGGTVFRKVRDRLNLDTQKITVPRDGPTFLAMTLWVAGLQPATSFLTFLTVAEVRWVG